MNSQVEFIRWQANAVAHALVREATSLASPVIYFNILHYINSIIFLMKRYKHLSF